MSDQPPEKPKVLQFEGKNDARAAVEKIARAMPELIEFAAHVAKLRRVHFLALKKEGFTDEQALKLSESPMGIGIISS